MDLEFREGRAQAAANLYSIGSKDRATVEARVGKAALRGSSAPGKSEISKPKEMKMRWADMRDGDEIGDEEGGDDEEHKGNGMRGDDDEEDRRSRTRGGDFREDSTVPDRWTCRGQGLTWTREHRTPRTSMFFPDEAKRGPSKVSELWHVRITEGRMQDGRKFIVTDDWTEASEETRVCIIQPWVGTCTFVMRAPEARLAKMRQAEDHDKTYWN